MIMLIMIMMVMALRCREFSTTFAQKPRLMPIGNPDTKGDSEDDQNSQENGDDDFFVTVWWRHW